MDALIRFSEVGFEDFNDVRDYFRETVKERDYYFNNASKINQIKEDDILYFSFKGKIVAVAQFTGKYKYDNSDFPHAYQIKNIKVFDSPIKINNSLFKGRTITYIKTDEQKEELKKIPYKLKDDEKNIIVKSLKIKNFTVFNDINLNFSRGINIFIGENGTGKSQILKLIYSIIKANDNQSRFNERIVKELKEVFRPTDKEISKLISFGKKETLIDIDLSIYKIKYSFTKKSKYEVNVLNIPEKLYEKKEMVFIPAQEILSHFKGFISIYKKREIAFDKTIYDLALNLDLPLLKDQKLINQTNEELEKILKGEIVQLNGEFYLRRFKDKELIVSSMMAEGLRKIGTMSYLIKNGALNKNSILFIDEPESNLNPKLIKAIAKFIIHLEKLDVQIFIATHSLFFIKELEILRKKEIGIKYFSFGFNNDETIRVSQSKDFDDLDDLVILDEELNQNDRFIKEVN